MMMMNTNSRQEKRLEVRRNFISNKHFDFEESTMARARYKISEITIDFSHSFAKMFAL